MQFDLWGRRYAYYINERRTPEPYQSFYVCTHGIAMAGRKILGLPPFAPDAQRAGS